MLTIISFFTFLHLLPSSLSASPHPFSKIYAFGDSFTDTGNTRSTSGRQAFTYVSSPPYGTTFFHHSTNRYSDGRLVIDFLTNELSLPFLPPYRNRNSNFTNGANFAVAGSTAIGHEFYVKNNISLDITPESLSTQLQWFDTYLKARGCSKKGSLQCNEAFKDALFWVGEIGVNDYAYTTIGSSMTNKEITDLVVDSINNFLQSLLERGAKYIVVQGTPLTGCLPLTLLLSPPDDRDDLKCSAIQNKNSDIHNLLLQSKLQNLRKQFPAAVISYADYHNAHRAIMKNPGAYGFAEPFKACCGTGGGPYNFDPVNTCGSPDVLKACVDPREYVNWDGVHLTEAMYRRVADLFFHGGYCKPSFDTLLSAKNM